MEKKKTNRFENKHTRNNKAFNYTLTYNPNNYFQWSESMCLLAHRLVQIHLVLLNFELNENFIIAHLSMCNFPAFLKIVYVLSC
jgi:hypothetical protein